MYIVIIISFYLLKNKKVKESARKQSLHFENSRFDFIENVVCVFVMEDVEQCILKLQRFFKWIY